MQGKAVMGFGGFENIAVGGLAEKDGTRKRERHGEGYPSMIEHILVLTATWSNALHIPHVQHAPPVKRTEVSTLSCGLHSSFRCAFSTTILGEKHDIQDVVKLWSDHESSNHF